MEDKAFELIEKIYVEMKNGFGQVNQRIDVIEKDIKEVTARLSSVEKAVLNIEQEQGQKLQVLFDGHKQQSDQLDRIEKEVALHEEVILRKVK